MKVLVANRGEIACRILKTLREMGVASVAVRTEVDAAAPHVWLADDVAPLTGTMGYLDIEQVLAAARATGATAIHPGYGFLSQNERFARAVAAAGLVFIGPSPEAMVALGDKRGSRALAEKSGIPVIPGASTVESVDEALDAAARVGYPVLLKAAGGGGGKGMRRVGAPDGMAEALAGAKREALSAFADGRLLIEKLIAPARHIEVQILGDGRDAVALGERECSLQRRYQKIIEESPALALGATTRAALHAAATKLARAAAYANAGTVEFLVAPDESFYFLEVNSRLQVEHPVTEMLTGLDLVRLQIEIAHGGRLPEPPAPRGHAIEARLNAEDPWNGFLPASGPVLMLEWPQRPQVRVDAGIVEGGEVLPYYDPLLAKIIAWGTDREEARRRLVAALRETTLLGLHTNLAFLVAVLTSDFFVTGDTYTTTIEARTWERPAVPEEALAAAKLTLAAPRASAGSGQGLADRYSPWLRLGGFRMGARA